MGQIYHKGQFYSGGAKTRLKLKRNLKTLSLS